MSHFTECQTAIKDLDLLLESLLDIGFEATIAASGESLPLFNYRGLITSKANIVVSRKQIHHLANDLGFVLENGCYKVIISEWDSENGSAQRGRGLGPSFVSKLTFIYATKTVEKVVQQYELQGASVSVREKLPDGTVKIRMSLPAKQQTRTGVRR